MSEPCPAKTAGAEKYRKQAMTDHKGQPISPYLTKPLRSVQEVLAERQSIDDLRRAGEARAAARETAAASDGARVSRVA